MEALKLVSGADGFAPGFSVTLQGAETRGPDHSGHPETQPELHPLSLLLSHDSHPMSPEWCQQSHDLCPWSRDWPLCLQWASRAPEGAIWD